MFAPLDPALVSVRGIGAVLATLCALLSPVALYRDTVAISRSGLAWTPRPRRYAAVGALAVFAPGVLAVALSLVGPVPWTVVAVTSLAAVSAVEVVAAAYLVRRFRRLG